MKTNGSDAWDSQEISLEAAPNSGAHALTDANRVCKREFEPFIVPADASWDKQRQ